MSKIDDVVKLLQLDIKNLNNIEEINSNMIPYRPKLTLQEKMIRLNNRMKEHSINDDSSIDNGVDEYIKNRIQ